MRHCQPVVRVRRSGGASSIHQAVGNAATLDAHQLGIPAGQDWWLFDSSVLVLMLFDDAGRLTAGS